MSRRFLVEVEPRGIGILISSRILMFIYIQLRVGISVYRTRAATYRTIQKNEKLAIELTAAAEEAQRVSHLIELQGGTPHRRPGLDGHGGRIEVLRVPMQNRN